MATKLAALLRTSMGLPDMAEKVRQGGRKGDTILAHINPKEARLLKKHGGSGEINPETGLPEFDDGGEDPLANQQTVNQEPAPAPESFGAPATTTGLPYGAASSEGTAGEVPMPQAQPAAMPAADFTSAPAQMGPSQTSPEFQMQTGPQQTAPALDSSMEQYKQGLGSVASEKAGNLASALGTDKMGLAKLGLGGLSALQGAYASNKAQKQAAAGQAQMEAMGKPFVDQGNQLLALGQAGGLTAPQQQQIQAMRAQAAQQLANTGQTGGGTMAQQSEAAIQRQAQQFAQDNITQGMQLVNVGNQYIQNAIKMGYQQSTDAQNAASNFYKNLMSGIPGAAQAPGQATVPGTGK